MLETYTLKLLIQNFFKNHYGRILAVDETLEVDIIILERVEDMKKGIQNLGI
jgi:hypothetical protein